MLGQNVDHWKKMDLSGRFYRVSKNGKSWYAFIEQGDEIILEEKHRTKAAAQEQCLEWVNQDISSGKIKPD